MKEIYAIFGGNFDPIHYGHLISAKNLAKEISIKKIILLPNHYPPHRNKTTTSLKDKIKMIKYATKNDNLFEISLLETTKKKILYYRNIKKNKTKNWILETIVFYNRRG